MKKLVTLMTTLIILGNVQGQILKRMADRAKQKLENKAGEKMEKGIDDAVDGKKKEKKSSTDTATKETSDSPQQNNNSGNNDSANETATADAEIKTKKEPTSLKAYSKYDFIPGEKILVYENFAQDAIGDFPGKWNTNSSGEIVSLSGREGKWFRINKDGAYLPEFITSLPDNFTLEFDLGVNNDFSFYSSRFYMSICNLAKPEEEYTDWGKYARWNGKHALRLMLHPTNAGGTLGYSEVNTSVSGTYLIDNTVAAHEFNNKEKNITHISIWRQKQRMRVYVNNEKIWDLPKAFALDGTYNSIVFGTTSFSDEDFYVINNIRLAVGAPDTRNKLITEGKFVTTGILFDVNSDQIRPESYGTIKDIANVLNENSGVKVKIIGHTDSDGDDKSNLDLSKRRAESVKNALIKEFNLDGSRIETDGKGESQPVDKAETPVAKANNRRVEFIKL